MRECVTCILQDDTSAEVFLLAPDGLLVDRPPPVILARRTQLLTG